MLCICSVSSAAESQVNAGESKQSAINLTSASDTIKPQVTSIDPVINDAVGPTVKGMDPVSNSVNVPIDKVITVTFNEPIKAGNNWIELELFNGTCISVNTSIKDNKLTICPPLLAAGTKYKVVLHTGSVKDLAGNSLALVVKYFTTINPRPVYITSDNIINPTTDINRINAIVKALTDLGVTAVNWGLGPNTHVAVLQDSKVPKNALVVNIYGGACAGTIYEMGLNYYKNWAGSRKVFNVWIPPAVDITGLAWLPRAHDDNFSPASFTGLARPDLYLLNNGYRYIYSASADLNTIINSIYQQALTW